MAVVFFSLGCATHHYELLGGTGSAFFHLFLLRKPPIYLSLATKNKHLSQSASLNGMWFAFIGWFLLQAAQGTSLQVTLRRELSRIPIANAMEPLGAAVPGATTVATALDLLVLAQGRRFFFVEEGGDAIGLVTLHQIRDTPPEECETTTVGAIMIPKSGLITAPFEGTLWQVFERMGEAEIHQVPVEAGGRILGVLTRERMVHTIHNVRVLGGR